MKQFGYGREYRYAHNEPDAFVAGEHYFPTDMKAMVFYEPVERGLEIKIGEKLKSLRALNEQAHKQKSS
jgi:putative ATPase